MEKIYEFLLAEKELEFLRQLALSETWLAETLNSHADAEGRKTVVRLGRVQIEQLRNCLTLKLAHDGFDENYYPNEHGDMLETLIDKFFEPFC